jgi:hypothetical protein
MVCQDSIRRERHSRRRLCVIRPMDSLRSGGGSVPRAVECVLANRSLREFHPIGSVGRESCDARTGRVVHRCSPVRTETYRYLSPIRIISTTSMHFLPYSAPGKMNVASPPQQMLVRHCLYGRENSGPCAPGKGTQRIPRRYYLAIRLQGSARTAAFRDAECAAICESDSHVEFGSLRSASAI